jgi:hypothetical protein
VFASGDRRRPGCVDAWPGTWHLPLERFAGGPYFARRGEQGSSRLSERASFQTSEVLDWVSRHIMHSKAPEIRQILSLLETSEVFSDKLLASRVDPGVCVH